jgi:leucyl-tRNA synthetase
MTLFHAEDFSDRPKMYVLVEFPYPSGSGLHIGHAFSFTGGDVYARFQRMQGKNVLFPIGWDAFGLPTENYAIRTGRPPQDVTRENTAMFRQQMETLGLSFDWERVVDTSNPSYYKWTQWIFIQLWKRGLAYKQEMPINWCPSCKIGLANEEVVDGRCERCGAPTERRRISQWVIKITEYADRLITGLDETEFIEKVKAAQVNWIGRSEGARIRFPVVQRQGVEGDYGALEVFTTRPDTLWGSTFMVIAPEHPLAAEAAKDVPQVAEYIDLARRRSEIERTDANREKTGVFTGMQARNPATGGKIPIWVSDFVLSSYGTGAIMSVPAHDDRDHEFAVRYSLTIKPVVQPALGDGEVWDFDGRAYTGHDGVAINSGPIDGLPVDEAISAANRWLEENHLGQPSVSYHLRDWIFSRQHYWGEPIPMIHCEQCGWNPVPEDQLPVVLPEVEAYKPTDTGESPLANITEWVSVTCPACGGPAHRETDTMPNWAGSNWYFLRYADPDNDRALADMDKLRYWMPVDVYIGGDEHNTLHLLYSRFIYQFLHDIGAVPADVSEPYRKRLSHGVILGPDSQRMSKSRGNVVVPEEYIVRVGADAVRCYLMFIGPFDATMAWNERALMGVKRFLDKVERYVEEYARGGQNNPATRTIINRLGRQISVDTAAFKFNTALAKMMEALNALEDLQGGSHPSELRDLVKIVSPYAPFLAEKLWQTLGLAGSAALSDWPVYDPSLELDEGVEMAVQVNGKLRGTIHMPRGASQETVRAAAEAEESVRRHLDGKQIVKIIHVPDRTINYVVR